MNPIDPLALMEIKARAEALTYLTKLIQGAAQRQENIDKAMAILDGEPNEATQRKFLRTAFKMIKEQEMANANLAQIAIVYLGGGSFEGDAAQLANKMGRGTEALQKMFKNKLGGKE